MQSIEVEHVPRRLRIGYPDAALHYVEASMQAGPMSRQDFTQGFCRLCHIVWYRPVFMPSYHPPCFFHPTGQGMLRPSVPIVATVVFLFSGTLT